MRTFPVSRRFIFVFIFILSLILAAGGASTSGQEASAPAKNPDTAPALKSAPDTAPADTAGAGKQVASAPDKNSETAPALLSTPDPAPTDTAGAGKKAAVVVQTQSIVRKDAKIDFTAAPVHTPMVLEGEVADISFRITDATTGAPIQTLLPSAWLDIKRDAAPKEGTPAAVIPVLSCDEKIRSYLRGILGYRPTLDLNSYFVLGMNNDSTISVIDPVLGISNYTQLFTMIYLKNPGEDWTADREEKFLFITMPKSHAVAVANTETFKLVKEIPAGQRPIRIAAQPDKKYLWVGNEPSQKDESGVTVIDADKQEAVARIKTGGGRHEFAFTDDNRYAFVTNGADNTLSVVDIKKLKLVKTIKTGGRPLAVDYSGQSKAAYVASEDGSILVVDGKTLRVVKTLALKPGISALRFAPGERWAFVANARENTFSIIDASNNSVAHTIKAGKEPDQIIFTKAFAYIHSRKAPTVTLLELANLGKEGTPPIVNVEAGTKAPADSPYSSRADAISPSRGEGHSLIVNPADNVIYYYMEGMNVPMGSFRVGGGQVPRAVRVVDRSLKETEQGVYSMRIRVPGSGKFDVAFFLDTPSVVHCFEFEAKPHPLFEQSRRKPDIEVLTPERRVKVQENLPVRFRFIYQATGEVIKDAADVAIRATHASGMPVEAYPATYVGDGVYEVVFKFKQPGPYMAVITSRKLKINQGSVIPLMLTAAPGEAKN